MLAFYLSLITEQADKKRFERIYLTYREKLVLIARGVLASKTEDEDCVEDAFLYMAKHFDRFADMDDEHAFAYLVTVVKSRAYDENDRREKTVFLEDTSEEEPSSDDLFGTVLYDDLRDAILRLPDGYRELLILSVGHGVRAGELAKLLSVSEPTIYRRLRAAKRILRDALTGDES